MRHHDLQVADNDTQAAQAYLAQQTAQSSQALSQYQANATAQMQAAQQILSQQVGSIPLTRPLLNVSRSHRLMLRAHANF